MRFTCLLLPAAKSRHPHLQIVPNRVCHCSHRYPRTSCKSTETPRETHTKKDAQASKREACSSTSPCPTIQLRFSYSNLQTIKNTPHQRSPRASRGEGLLRGRGLQKARLQTSNLKSAIDLPSFEALLPLERRFLFVLFFSLLKRKVHKTPQHIVASPSPLTIYSIHQFFSYHI